MLIPLGSQRLCVPAIAAGVSTTLAGGVILPPPVISVAANSTIEPEHLPTLNCSLVNQRLPLTSTTMPQGLFIVGRPPRGVLLLSVVIAVTGLTGPLAAASWAADIATIVFPTLLATHRLPLLSN